MAFAGAKLALFIGDQLAVILRDDDPDIVWPNHWDFPGGGREGDETPLECVLRETYEELGVALNPHCVEWGKQFDDQGAQKWFFVARLPADAAGRIALGDEGQMWTLMTPAQYFALPNHIAPFAQRLQVFLSGGAGDVWKKGPPLSERGK